MDSLRILNQVLIAQPRRRIGKLFLTFCPLAFFSIREWHVDVLCFLWFFRCALAFLVIKWTCLEQVITSWNVLESMAQNVRALRLVSIRSSNAMCTAQILILWRYYIVLRENNRLSSHWWSFVSSRSHLHNLLQVGRQLHQRPSDFCFISLNLKRNISRGGRIRLLELVWVVFRRDIHGVDYTLLTNFAVVILSKCLLDYLLSLAHLLVQVLRLP